MDHQSRLVDKAALAGTSSGSTPAGGGFTVGGFGYTTDWVDVGHYAFFSISAVFTGGTPGGELSLQQSNAAQWTGGSPVTTLFAKLGSAVSDAADVPAGSGQNSVTVAAAGAYVLNQWLVGYKWVRLVYTPTSNVATQFDVFMNVKTG